MDHNSFVNWLDGFLSDKDRELTVAETKLIENKLNSCFVKVTPELKSPSDTIVIDYTASNPNLKPYDLFNYNDVMTKVEAIYKAR